MTDQRLITTIEELILNIDQFNLNDNLIKQALGSQPRYFIVAKINGENTFNLSKFVAIKDINFDSYLTGLRKEHHGSKTQKRLSKVLQTDWKGFKSLTDEQKAEFSKWITSFLPSYKLDKSNFIFLQDDISLSLENNDNKQTIGNNLSLEQLEEKLELQKKIGEIGENIAIDYEYYRLVAMGYDDSEITVEHVSQDNVSLGYDILSETPDETRHIEVKSSLQYRNFYISRNEINILRELKNSGYIYLVQITNFDKEEGEIVKEIQDPISKLEEHIQPIMYQVNIGDLDLE